MSDIPLLQTVENWVLATCCDRAVKCDLCCKGLIGSISSVSGRRCSHFLTYLKTLGDIYLALNGAGCSQIIYLCLVLPLNKEQSCFCGIPYCSLEISIYIVQQEQWLDGIFSQRIKAVIFFYRSSRFKVAHIILYQTIIFPVIFHKN